jgi:hypothetical protein
MNDTRVIAGDHMKAGRRPFSITGHEAEAVTQRVWGNVDTVMLIFAGAAAEFAVNRAVDWLFWTNALPSAPIKRFFETVSYAQAVLLGDPRTVAKKMAAINGAHRGVERSRGYAIPAWAYRDVLFMLIDYGERAHRVVYGPMTPADRQAHWVLMRELGEELHITDLPADYPAYQAARHRHLLENTARTAWTDQLYAAYRKDLGPIRMPLLLHLQASLLPEHVAGLLGLRRRAYMDRLLRLYRHVPHTLVPHLAPWLLPRQYFGQMTALTRPASNRPQTPTGVPRPTTAGKAPVPGAAESRALEGP